MPAIDYRLQQMIKSILKSSQTTQSSERPSKEPLRVTFAIAHTHTHTQEDSNAERRMSWMDDHRHSFTQERKTQESQQEEEDEKKKLFWEGANEFKRANIAWQGFMLVYNPKFTLDSLHCGKCATSFNRVSDFAFHCLMECSEISHKGSSHFVFKTDDWQRFVDAQRSKAARSPSLDPNCYASLYEKRMKDLQAFTKATLEFWRESGLQETFTVGKHYMYDCGLIMLLNPIHEDYSHAYFYEARKECPLYVRFMSPYSREMMVIQHFNNECCKINTPQSAFLLLDADMFYAYLYERGFANEKGKFDLAYQLYLHDRTPLQTKIKKNYPKLEQLRIFIELFYGMPTLLPQIHTLMPKSEKPNRKMVKKYRGATFIIHYWKEKTIRLAFNSEYLQSRTFCCLCCDNPASMTFEQFSAHLKLKGMHKPIDLKQLFTK